MTSALALLPQDESLTEARQLLAELWSLVFGLAGPLGPVRLQSRQELEQSLLRDLAASSFQVRERRETEAAFEAVLLGLEGLVPGGEAALGRRSLCRARRGS